MNRRDAYALVLEAMVVEAAPRGWGAWGPAKVPASIGATAIGRRLECRPLPPARHSSAVTPVGVGGQEAPGSDSSTVSSAVGTTSSRSSGIGSPLRTESP